MSDSEDGANSPLGVGIIGTGFMGRVHAHAARVAGADIRAVASSSVERAEAVHAEFHAHSSVTDAVALCEDPDVEVVHVCTPNDTHLAYALAALEAGKHVVCEKPLATNVADASQLHQASVEAMRVATVPFVYRYHPLVREARHRVVTHGPAFSIDASYLQDWMAEPEERNWRVDAGTGGSSRAFADIGSHLFDLIEFISGDRVSELVATSRTVYEQRDGLPVCNEDLVSVLFQLDGGGSGVALVSQVAPGRKNALTVEVHTSDESVRFEQERPDELWIGGVEASRIVSRGSQSLSADAARLSHVPPGHPMGYQDAFNAFIADTYDAIRGERVEGLPTFRDGLRAAQLTEAVLESVRTRQWVSTSFQPHGHAVSGSHLRRNNVA